MHFCTFRCCSHFISFFIISIGLLNYSLVQAAHTSPDTPVEADWGVAVTVRTADIVYESIDDSVTSFVPMLFFDGERFFLDGLGGGIKLYNNEKFRMDLFGRMRFVDIPRDFQNDIQADTIDLGARIKLFTFERVETDLELLTDDYGRSYGNIQLNYFYEHNKLELMPFAIMRFTSGEYNDYYYGLGQEKIGRGTQFSLGINARYHIYQNLYGIGRLQTTFLDNDARESSFVDQDSVTEIYLGIGFFNENQKKEKRRSLHNTPYLRLAHGWATSSNIGDIISGGTVSDPHNNQLTSLFYGHPLADSLFGIPLDIYLTPGFIWHWDSSVQKSIQEYAIGIKAYYTFTWPTRWRFGFAEGLSYVSDIPFVENSEMERKGYEPSMLMNYLDFSIDLDLGDLLSSDYLKNWYFGYSIHHRSAIFESASQFGRISGGSNYNTIYLQYHF